MTDKKQQPLCWADVMACSYCVHYREVGRHGAGYFCQNEKSPYYDKSCPSLIGTELTFEQELRGCNQFKHNGKKIPPSYLKYIPIDSELQNHLEEIVIDFTEEMKNLKSGITVEEMVKKYQTQYHMILDMFEKYKHFKIVDEKLVPANKK